MKTYLRTPQARIALTFLVIVLIIVLFAVFIDLESVYEQLRRADWRLLLGASAALVAGMWAYGARWRFLLENRPAPLHAFHAANIGHMANTYIPLRAGEAARILVMGRSGAVSYPEATSSVVVERLLEQIMRLLAFGGMIAFGISADIPPASILGGLFVVVLIMLGLVWMVNNRQTVLEKWPRALARVPKLTEQRAASLLGEMVDGLAGLASARQVALAYGLTLLTWFCFWVFHYLALRALPTGLPPGEILAISFGALALAPPSAPTQPGVYHASVVAPLVVVGFNETLLTSYAVIMHALQMLWMTALGVWGLSGTGFSLGELFASREQTAGGTG